MEKLIFQSVFSISSLGIDLLTLLVTALVAYFAYRLSDRQLNVQKHQLKHDLYDRRYAIYESLKKTFGDNDDKTYSVKDLTGLYNNYTPWFNNNHDHLMFLFEKNIFDQANSLYDSLRNEPNKFDKKVDLQPFNNKYEVLKSRISEELNFKNIK